MGLRRAEAMNLGAEYCYVLTAAGQPLADGGGKAKKDAADKAAADAAPVETKVVEKVVYAPVRKRLPKSRVSRTTSFTVGGAEGYMTSGAHDDGQLGEVFLKLGKQGSTLAGVMDAFSIAISIALQYGVPLETYVEKFTNMRFEPAGGSALSLRCDTTAPPTLKPPALLVASTTTPGACASTCSSSVSAHRRSNNRSGVWSWAGSLRYRLSADSKSIETCGLPPPRLAAARMSSRSSECCLSSSLSLPS